MIKIKSAFLYVLIIGAIVFTTACGDSNSHKNKENSNGVEITHELGKTRRVD